MNSHPFTARLLRELPLMTPGALVALLHSNITKQAAEHPFLTGLRDKTRPKATQMADGILHIPVYGTLARRPDVWELLDGSVEDTSAILDLINAAAAEDAVRGVLLDIDSPGGFLTGGPEVADAVKQTAKTKPVVAWTGGMAASLGYWIASQATEIVASRSAEVGSIGVLAAAVDASAFYAMLGFKVEVFRNTEGHLKAPGAFNLPMTEDQRTWLQADIDAAFSQFKAAVKSTRPQVSDDMLHGQTASGREAKSAGLIDRIGDQPYALAVLRRAIRQQNG